MANSGREQTIERRYVMGDELGGGEYGVVRRARDTLLDRDVAVKEVRFPSEGREQFRARLLRETQAAAGLNHSGAVTIFDVVEEHDSALIVMELVDAPTLAQLVERSGPVPPKRVAAIGVELLDTLVAAHERGIVHRDVKPSNVMVSDDGRVRLSDFGVGAAMQSDQGTTSPYASPEQRSGGAVGAASDLWSLGATLSFAMEGGSSGALGPVLAMMTAASSDERPSPYALRQMLSRVAAGTAAAGPAPAVALAPDEADDTTASIDTADLPATEAVAVPPQPGGPDGPVMPGEPGPTVIPEPDPPQEPGPPPEPGPTPAPEPVPPTEPVPEEPLPLPSPEPARPVPPEVVPPVDPEPAWPVPPEIVAPVEPEMVPPSHPEVPPSHPEVVPPQALRGADGRRGGLLLLLGAVAVAVLVALVLARSGDNGSDSNPPTAQPQTGAADTAATSDAAVPADWVAYTDPETGFAISHPPGWTIRRDGTITDFRDPDSGAYMRVDHTDDPGPSPEGDWYDLEKRFEAENDDYQRIRITPTTYAGFPAAVWEFTYSDGGASLHASDLGFTTPRHGFALYAQSRASDWDRMQPVFAQFRAAFEAPA